MTAEDRIRAARRVISTLGGYMYQGDSFVVADHRYLESGFIDDLIAALDGSRHADGPFPSYDPEVIGKYCVITVAQAARIVRESNDGIEALTRLAQYAEHVDRRPAPDWDSFG